jgi:multicomponent Na+:H+ antiporter subunit G
MTLLNLLTAVLLAAGLFFFAAGTVGLLRFPDLYSRLHTLTKADNVGLGFTLLALMLQAEGWIEVLKLALIWAMVLVGSATVCFLIGNEGLRRRQALWTRLPSGELGPVDPHAQYGPGPTTPGAQPEPNVGEPR